jgi:hypothetical protein
MWLSVAESGLNGEERKKASDALAEITRILSAAQLEKAHELSIRCQQSALKQCDD